MRLEHDPGKCHTHLQEFWTTTGRTPSPTASPSTTADLRPDKDVADPQTTQKVFASFKGIGRGINNYDTAAIAAITRATRFFYDRGANHRSGSHSEMECRPVTAGAPKTRR